MSSNNLRFASVRSERSCSSSLSERSRRKGDGLLGEHTGGCNKRGCENQGYQLRTANSAWLQAILVAGRAPEGSVRLLESVSQH